MSSSDSLGAFWVERLLTLLPYKYYFNSVFLGLIYIVSMWLVGAVVPNGLARVSHDLGLYLVTITLVLVLFTVYKYVSYLRKFLVDVVKDYFDVDWGVVSSLWRLSTGWPCILFGFIGILVTQLILIYKGVGLSMGDFYTGLAEMPYSGSFTFAMKYTSIPILVVTSAFWLFFEFLAGNIFWLNISMIIILWRIHRFGSKVGSIIDPRVTSYLNSAGRLILYSIAMPTVAMFMTPTVFTMPRIFAELTSIYFYGYYVYLGYIIFLIAASSVILYMWVNGIKEDELNIIRPKVLDVRKMLDKGLTLDNGSYLNYLIIMHLEDKIRKASVAPLSLDTIYKVVTIIVLPLLVQLLAQLIIFVLRI